MQALCAEAEKAARGDKVLLVLSDAGLEKGQLPFTPLWQWGRCIITLAAWRCGLAST